MDAADFEAMLQAELEGLEQQIWLDDKKDAKRKAKAAKRAEIAQQCISGGVPVPDAESSDDDHGPCGELFDAEELVQTGFLDAGDHRALYRTRRLKKSMPDIMYPKPEEPERLSDAELAQMAAASAKAAAEAKTAAEEARRPAAPEAAAESHIEALMRMKRDKSEAGQSQSVLRDVPAAPVMALSEDVDSILFESAALADVARAAPVESLLEVRPAGGLRTLRRLRGGERLKVCYLGGSITEQSQGWRPYVHSWLNCIARAAGGAAEAVPAYCGNCNSKLLAFMVEDWVVKKRPDMLFIEVCINDADTILELGEEGARDVRRALEGILRQVRAALPDCDIVFVEMYIREEVARRKRTGTKAWVETDDRAKAAAVYHKQVPQLHTDLARHYGCGVVNLINLNHGLDSETLDDLFRDDVHHSLNGARLSAHAVSRCLIACDADADEAARSTAALTLPAPQDSAFWVSTGAHRITELMVTMKNCYNFVDRGTEQFKKMEESMLSKKNGMHYREERCPLTGEEKGKWFLMYAKYSEETPHEDCCAFRFNGTSIGLVTIVGPDSGTLLVEVDGGKWNYEVNMCDQWCFFWRPHIIMLAEGLPEGSHVVRITIKAEKPDHEKILKRPCKEPMFMYDSVGQMTKLWLRWFVTMDGKKVDAEALEA